MPHFLLDYPGQTGVRLDYTDCGEGSPPVVLVHGFSCARSDWQHQLQALSSTHRTIAVDLPGHGTSTRQVPGCRIEYLGKHLAALLDQLDLRQVILVGHSMGCRVILQATLGVADRVAALVMVEGSRIGQGDGTAREAEIEAICEGDGFASLVRAVLGDTFVGNQFADGPGHPLETGIIARGEALDPQTGTRLFASMLRWDAETLEPALRKLDCPITAIQSTRVNADRKRITLGPGDTTTWLDLIRQRSPDARIKLMYGFGHFIMLEAPQEVTSWIRSVASTGTA